MRAKSTSNWSETGMFGPETDLIVSLVAVLLLLMSIQRKKDNDTIKLVNREQTMLMKEVVKAFHSDPRPEKLEGFIIRKDSTDYKIIVGSDTSGRDIIISNDVYTQKFKFGSSILFDNNSSELKREGKDILTPVRDAICRKINSIQEIRIEGHADTQRSASNMVLASERANSVYEHLISKEGNSNCFDPATKLISIASFGEFKPVGRKEEMSFSQAMIDSLNNTEPKRAINRRIEIVLTYKHEKKFE